MQPSDVRSLLSQVPLGRQVVEVVWPFDRVAFRIDYADIVRHYDDLWYPSRDDVWILSPDRTNVVGIDHEEVVLIAEAVIG